MADLVDILLVDDEPRNLDALEAILVDEEYRLLRAEDADKALRLLLDNEVAAIVLDIQMPRVNGIELAQIIKGTKRFRQIPILFLTAHMVEDQDVITGYGVGAVDYVTKPFNPQILRRKVAVFAELFRKTRALAELNEKLEQRVQERTAELEKSEDALRAAARQKDEFLAILAHELRNPLAPLRTGLDLLLKANSIDSQVVQRTLTVMNRQVDHLVRLIDDLLDISRINRGVLELKKETSDLSTLVRSTVESFRPVLEKRRISLSMGPSVSMSALVDPTRISQIVGNLLHNAGKFTPPGGSVHVELEQQEGRAAIRIIDSGVGIPAEQMRHVFELFARVARPSTVSEQGAGIGLALAQRIAQMHGGELTAWSEGENRGTTFTLTLPLLKVDAAPDRAEPPAPPVRPEPSGSLDVLVIEDNDDVAELLVFWLQDFGHRVTVARTGEEGVRMVTELRPRVVLCDLGLPELDGYQVCMRVRENARDDQPVMIAITGWGKAEDRLRTKEAGFDHHLVKPVEPTVLADLLRGVKDVQPKSGVSAVAKPVDVDDGTGEDAQLGDA